MIDKVNPYSRNMMGDLLSYLMKMQGADVAEFQSRKILMLFQQQLTAGNKLLQWGKSRNLSVLQCLRSTISN